MKISSFIQRSLILCCLLSFSLVQAAYLKNISIRLVQPDGRELNVFASGDEFYNWIHDANNFTIIKDPVTGFYVYAGFGNGDLFPTQFIAGQSDPQVAGLSPGLNIPCWKMELIRQDFLEATPQKPSIQPPLYSLVQDASGTVNNIVVFIRFSDQVEFPSALTVYSELFNNPAVGANSMYNYFKDVSYNTLLVPSTFYPVPAGTVIVSYQDTHPRNYYMPYDATDNPGGYLESERTGREHTLLKNAVNAISGQVPPALNIDFDNDGYVDNVCFIVRGTTTAWSTLLWPHRWALFTQSAFINGKQVWDYNLQLETFLSSSGVGVLAHEMTHTFGCPDLYHYSDDDLAPVGPWDLMANNANPPQHIGAYMKLKYTGWISSIPTITSSGTYTLNPLGSPANNAYRLNSPNSSTEFFIFEYRRKTGTFESSIPASGLLIYRINMAAGNGNAGGPPDEIYVYRPNGTISANGNINSAYFSNSSGRTEFDNYTNPSDFLSDGITMGDINISSVTDANATISFTVLMGSVPNFSANITHTCINHTVLLTDLSAGGPTSWNWSFSPATVVFVNGTSASFQHPQIQFTAAGSYSVTLTVNGPGGLNSKTKTDYIQAFTVSLPSLSEDFESGSFSTNDWSLINPDGSIGWDLFTGASGNGASTGSAFMNFYDYSATGERDEMLSKPFNLTGTVAAQLTFKVAYRPYSSQYHDTLKIMISTDCGTTYAATVYNKTGNVLATGPPTTDEFEPSSVNDWRLETIDLSAFLGTTVFFKFQAINDYGNNLYIDDINLTAIPQVLADFSATPSTICQGGNVQFADLSSGSPTTWLWDFGDGSFSTLQNPAHQYAAAGNYTVMLTAANGSNNHSMVKSNYITVIPISQVSVSIAQSPAGIICQNSTVSFTATVTNGGLSPGYQWKKDGADVGDNLPYYEDSMLFNGQTISCVVTPTVDCPSANPVISNSIVTIVEPLPMLVLGNDTTISSLFPLTLDAGPGFSNYQWSTGDGMQTIVAATSGIYSITVTTQAGCQASASIGITVDYSNIQGFVNYSNAANTPMNNSVVSLMQGSSLIAQTTSDELGYYFFDALPQGTYKIVPSSAKPWGGVNSTDALMILRHFVGLSYLTGINLKAANVDLISVVNTLDAFIVQKRFVQNISSFLVGDWAFDNPVVSINGLIPVTKNIPVLAYGDVNSSYEPLSRNGTGVYIQEGEMQLEPKNSLIDIPLFAASRMEIGAISLILDYPYKLLQFNGVSLEQGDRECLVFAGQSGRIAISWADINPIVVNPLQPLLNLHFSIIEEIPEGYLLSCTGNSEFADAEAVPIEGASLFQPFFSLTNTAPGISIMAYPNPFRGSTSIGFTIPESTRLTISVYNNEGQKVKTLLDQEVYAGSHTIDWNGNNDSEIKLAGGVYYLRLLTSGQTKISRLILMP